MKIHFERTGGFMGLRMVAAFDTNDLPEEDAATLLRLLDEIDFFELPARLESSDPAMDQFHYVLTVSREQIIQQPEEEPGFWERLFTNKEEARPTEDAEEQSGLAEAHTHTVTFTDTAVPAEMLTLVRMLTRMAHGE